MPAGANTAQIPVTAGTSAEAAMADNHGRRIGILIVAYNAVTTLAKVFQRITPEVWNNVEEVVVFDDASQDHTYELAIGYKTLQDAAKLNVIKNEVNLGYGGNQKAGYRYFAEKGFDVVVLLHGDGQYAPELSKVERAFRSLKSVDLNIRLILAPMLFDPTAGEALRPSIVAPAQRSPSAAKKAPSKRSADGMPVDSLQTLPTRSPHRSAETPSGWARKPARWSPPPPPYSSEPSTS